MAIGIENIEYWINSAYCSMFNNGTLDALCDNYPFRHVVMENFFSSYALEKIEAAIDNCKLEQSHKKGVALYAEWEWGGFYNAEFLKFFYGKKFRQFLYKLLGDQLAAKVTQYPQLNVLQPNSRGLPIHNDQNEDIDYVTLINMTPTCGEGGELILYEKVKDKELYLPFKIIPPKKNTLTILQINSHSYHSVSDIKGDWKRYSINIDWYNSSRIQKNNENSK